MMLQTASNPTSAAVQLPETFPLWRSGLTARDVPPVIAIAGSRGKSSVVRLLDAILGTAGLRTALWTDLGVEINGRRQRGELVPWSRALAGLGDGSLDLAVQELDWDTVHAVGLPTAIYPIVAVTNLCVNSESCLAQTESGRALRSLVGVRSAVRPDGVLVLNGEDHAVVGAERGHQSPTIYVALSPDPPLLRTHLDGGGTAAWTEDGRLWVGHRETEVTVGDLADLPLSMAGAVGFQVHNALTAAAVALACGITPTTVATALADFISPSGLMPGSFNVVSLNGATVVVDRPAPSWFLRPALRAVAHMPHTRLLRVVGGLSYVPASDLVELGRLLGRSGGAVILHGQSATPDRAALLRQGIAANQVPPVIVQVETERQALGRALKIIRPSDLLLILAEQPAVVLRALDRAGSRSETVDAP